MAFPNKNLNIETSKEWYFVYILVILLLFGQSPSHVDLNRTLSVALPCLFLPWASQLRVIYIIIPCGEEYLSKIYILNKYHILSFLTHI